MIDKCCDTNAKESCNNVCCFKSSDNNEIAFIFNKSINFSKKIINIYSFKILDLDFINLSLKDLENNKLVKLNSPPFLHKKIKYYSYVSLT